jgi:AcrR family transcriptional regulator
VIDKALALADEHGVEALTMPALARAVDCGVMTLYGYVEDKKDLLDAMALRGLADLRLARPLPESAAGILTAWGRALRATLLRHPSMAVIFLTQSVIGEGIFRGLEALLGALRRAGMAPRVGVHAVYAVIVYTTGFVAWELPRTHAGSTDAYGAEWRRGFAALPPAELPLTAGVLDELPQVAGEAQFETGLDALARGLAGAQR